MPTAPLADRVPTGPDVLVSVIVAVYNPGDAITDLLDSLDAQSLSPDRFEVVLVDDDSTDGTRERLHEWARSRPHVTVLHNTPNSGWPGRPRNLGIDAAAGEFVFFADHDDRFHPEGLRRMVDYAHEVGADVVLAKEAGIGPGRGVAPDMFRRDVPDARLGRDPILRLLTPHKLFRTAMVREHGIRFPEGRVRLEDHAFVVACYFAARRIAIYSRHVCYFWMHREGRASATYQPIDPRVYFDSVARVLTVVEQNTEPGELRDRLYAHWYKTKMLRMLTGDELRWRDWSYQRSTLRNIRDVVDRFGIGLAQHPYLGAAGRARDILLREGTLGQLRRLGAVERGIATRVDTASVEVDGDRIRIEVTAYLVDRRGRRLQLQEIDGRQYWVLPLLARTRSLQRVDVTDLASSAYLEVVATDVRNGGRTVLPVAEGHAAPGPGLAASSTVLIDPRAWPGEDGAPLDLRVRVIACGWFPDTPLPLAAAQQGLETQGVHPALGDHGGLRLARAPGQAARSRRSLLSGARRLALAVARPPVRAARLVRRMVR